MIPMAKKNQKARKARKATDHGGPELLREWCDAQPRGAQSYLARELGIHRSNICDILHRRSRPTLDMAFAIEALTGVPPESWLAQN